MVVSTKPVWSVSAGMRWRHQRVYCPKCSAKVVKTSFIPLKKGGGIWHSAGGTHKEKAFLKSPLAALKAISIFYISEAVVV
jgi:hypothetical protein